MVLWRYSFTFYTVHPFKVYRSVTFSPPELCNRHPAIRSRIFTQKESLFAVTLSPHPPQPYIALICFLSLWVCCLGSFLYAGSFRVWPLVTGSSHSVQGSLSCVWPHLVSFRAEEFSVLGSVCSGRHGEIPRLGASPRVLEVGGLGSRCWQGSLRPPLLADGCRGHPSVCVCFWS